MSMISRDLIKDVTVTILRRAEVKLPRDVKLALQRAYEEEENEIAKLQLQTILNNVTLAEKTLRPLCQDTGLPIFYVCLRGDISKHVNFSDIAGGIKEGVKEATEIIPLRPNVVNAITRAIAGKEGNVGLRMPYINYKIVEAVTDADTNSDSDYLEITAFPKGAGSENVSTLAMLTPTAATAKNGVVAEITKFVLQTVITAGGKPCPPVIVGVGIGGTADMAMSMAKEALIRPVGARGIVAKIEEELLDAINNTGIGPMGLGGKTTALDVHVETADCHIASLPVAVTMQCWAARKARARIYPRGMVEYV